MTKSTPWYLRLLLGSGRCSSQHLSAVSIVEDGVNSAAGNTGELAGGVKSLNAAGNSGGGSETLKSNQV